MAKMEQLMAQKEQLSEIPRKQRYATRPTLDKTFQATDEREMKIYQAGQEYGYILKEIAEYFGVHYTTVSKTIK